MNGSTDKAFSISVIGGGASAALLLAHLAGKFQAGAVARITVHDRAGGFARGIAYSTKNPVHLLNVRAGNMSALAGDPGHFCRWIAENNLPWTETDFVPRMVYADYLRGLWDNAVETLRAGGCEVVLRQEEINDSQPGTTATVIATGNAVPVSPAGAGNLSAADGYHDSPWAVDYAGIAADVMILGTGLSMVDTVMALDAAGFRGKITAISRHGLLPAVHAVPASFPPPFSEGRPDTALGLLHGIKGHVQKAREKNVPWQAAIDSLRSLTNPLWIALDEKEKKKARRLIPFWNIHRHRMAPEAAAAIGRLRDSGRLEIVRDRVESVEKGITVRGRKGLYRAGTVINCLGYRPDKAFVYRPGMEKEGIFALGPPLFDYYFETTAIPEIRVQAEEIADRLLNR